MCCLFGIYNYSGKNIKTLPKLTNALAREATIRGLDATGIAYNNKGHLLIHLESQKQLNEESIKYMAEKVDGSFSFTVLTEDNTLWLIKGDSPLSIVHFPEKKVYVYASTDEILYKGLIGTDFFKDIKDGKFEELDISAGQILKITDDGELSYSTFKYVEDYLYGYNWWYCGKSRSRHFDDGYLDDLKCVAKNNGYTDDAIDDLIDEGFTMEEIEEFIYSY